ncbi:RagB/SusD family nutrient uptake outer membrane protein [Flavobacterium psychroterrae]|uniref:RagB/SusD family nutrient uptake outer membrane protein n=1 Tax=Flavobacterium psychroterrae TaxID=2133767 RepID=A0ABS5PIM5_9FLAO|nr:RagB/SusD family nutrient uptake outer membrane protein [Flavobacterium psychroterrae]MBS7234168.1 RagB/SusD family nutrient uptake outer membrane protein [Flavobacterium psychroterrae]
MIKQLTKYPILLSIIVVLSSCDSFVEVDLPNSQLTNTAVFEDYSTANAALMDIYAKMRDTGILTGTNMGISNQMGNYTDELMASGDPSNLSWPFYNNSVLPSSSNVAEYWNASYNQIYAANALLEGTEQSKTLSSEDKKQLQGEALFIRALLHFYLLNLFGDIPYIKETDYKKNSTATRIPTQEVYQHIIADLERAQAILPIHFDNPQKVRADKYTIKALLARVYLYTKSFAEAANEASSLLNQTDLYSLEDNLSGVFLISSRETIWQFQSSLAGQNTKEGSLFIFEAGPPSITALNPLLINSFATDDLRKANWTKSVTDGTSVWYYSYKYKEQNATAVSKEYSVVFRLAEQYLIRAEARAQQGDLIGAKEDLNKIRTRAGLPNTIAITQQQLLIAVLQERYWEFFTEQGHRFFDLKRSSELDKTLSGIKPGWKTTDSLLPIPQNELSVNPNLRPQNPGY